MSEPSLWRNERFIRLWGAQTISLLATATALPAPLFGLLAGVWTDRLRRVPILIGTDLGRAAAGGSAAAGRSFGVP